MKGECILPKQNQTTGLVPGPKESPKGNFFGKIQRGNRVRLIFILCWVSSAEFKMKISQ